MPKNISSITSPGIYVAPHKTPRHEVRGARTDLTAFVGCFGAGPVDSPIEISSLAAFEDQLGPSSTSIAGRAVASYFANDGKDAIIINIGKWVEPSDPASQAGVYSLNRLGKDGFDLLCLPDVSAIAPSLLYWSIYKAATQICRHHRAFMIVDPPAEMGAQQVDDWATQMRVIVGAQGAAFYPRLLDPEQQDLPPCGAVAGRITQFDRDAIGWKAPAGIEAILKGARLDRTPYEEETAHLTNLNLVPIRQMSHASPFPVIWGSRTLQNNDAPEFRYINVKRLAMFLDQSIDASLEPIEGEANSPKLWAAIRQGIDRFLQDQWRLGAFSGTKQADAYFLECGLDTMTQNDVDEGLIKVIVGFAPLKPAEFITLHFSAKTAR